MNGPILDDESLQHVLDVFESMDPYHAIRNISRSKSSISVDNMTYSGHTVSPETLDRHVGSIKRSLLGANNSTEKEVVKEIRKLEYENNRKDEIIRAQSERILELESGQMQFNRLLDIIAPLEDEVIIFLHISRLI